MLKNLKATGRIIVNTYCGLVTFKGERLEGCGAEPGTFAEYSYDAGSGCTSTVVFCHKCEPDPYALHLNETFADIRHWGVLGELRIEFTIDVKLWRRMRDNKGLGRLYGVDLSNYLRRNGVLNQYCVPVVDDSKRAKNGRKTVRATYCVSSRSV